jgi:hypothetical protein
MAASRSTTALFTAIALLAAGTVTPASAACKKFSFLVNDYGKDGPTKDAKELLDKYIADWAKQRGIGKYTTGKKDVSCELFLDFGFFDEHTCKAEATVCWPDGGAPVTASVPAAAPKAQPKKPAKAATAQ